MKQFRQHAPLRSGVVLLTILASGVAFAHGLPQFIYDEPIGANNPADAGIARVRWTDYGVYGFIDLWVTPNALPPYGFADPIPTNGLLLSDGGLETHSPVNVFEWDVSQVAPGCYQPYARYDDFGDYYLLIAPGKLVVSSDAGIHPSVFITNPRGEFPPPDGGTVFELSVETADPDDATTLTLSFAPTSSFTTFSPIGAPLQLDAGVGTQRIAFDTKDVDAGNYALHAELVSADGEHCEAYWPFVLTVVAPPAKADAGVDAGNSSDGGSTPRADAGSHVELGEPEDAGRPTIRVLPPTVADTGCSATSLGPVLLLALIPLARRMRYRRDS